MTGAEQHTNSRLVLTTPALRIASLDRAARSRGFAAQPHVRRAAIRLTSMRAKRSVTCDV